MLPSLFDLYIYIYMLCENIYIYIHGIVARSFFLIGHHAKGRDPMYRANMLMMLLVINMDMPLLYKEIAIDKIVDSE